MGAEKCFWAPYFAASACLSAWIAGNTKAQLTATNKQIRTHHSSRRRQSSPLIASVHHTSISYFQTMLPSLPRSVVVPLSVITQRKFVYRLWAACLQHDEWATEMRVDDGRRVELEEDDNGQILIFTVVNNDRFFGQGVTGYSFPFWQRKWWNVYFKSTYFFDYEGGHHSTKSCSCSQTLEFIKEQHSARFASLTDHLVKSGRTKAKMLY